jgi:hypothetical protein
LSLFWTNSWVLHAGGETLFLWRSNFGATCYINAVFRHFFHVGDFRRVVFVVEFMFAGMGRSCCRNSESIVLLFVDQMPDESRRIFNVGPVLIVSLDVDHLANRTECFESFLQPQNFTGADRISSS